MLYIEKKFGGNLKISCGLVVNWIAENGLIDEYNTFAGAREMIPTCLLLNDFYQAYETEQNAIPFC